MYMHVTRCPGIPTSTLPPIVQIVPSTIIFKSQNLQKKNEGIKVDLIPLVYQINKVKKKKKP